MHDLAALLPLAQLNTPIGTPGSAPAVESTATAAPSAGATAGAAATGASGGGQGAGAAATSTSATTATSPSTQPAPPTGLFGGQSIFLPIILMLVVLYFVMFRGQRKEEKKRKQMVAELKKGDKVMTIGGMLASVVSVDDDRVVLKIDESNNIKATYRKSAIQEVIDRDEKKS